MGAILVIAWLLLMPIGIAAGAAVAFLILGKVFSNGDDGDPPPDLAAPSS